MRKRRARWIAGLPIFLSLVACGAAPRPDAPPNIVMIVVDTLRADHLPSYGYLRDTAPGISRLAASGVLFERVIAPSSWTKTSMASIMTGQLPASHGVLRHRNALPSRTTTLASRLASQGYRTLGVNTNPWLQAQFGFDAGFDVYETIRHAKESGVATEVNRRALALLAASPRDRPVFLYLHFMDVHAPYRITGVSTAEDAALEYAYRKEGLDDPGVQERVIELYDAGIHALDAELSTLRRELAAVLPAEETLTVLTSDHGEAFREHGNTEHGKDLYPEVLEVPLIFAWPGVLPEGVRVAAQVRSIDIAPTLLALAQGSVPDSFEGSPLLPLTGHAIEDRLAHSELYFRRPLDPFHLAAVISPDHFFVHEKMSGTTEFYDLRADPGAQHDLGGDDPRAARYAASERSATVIRPAERTLDAGTRDELEALGYLK